jgi:DNA-binding transcriptional MerR regulator
LTSPRGRGTGWCHGRSRIRLSSLLTAGRFSDLSLLSAKALRIYADNGLLRPVRVDPHNGYRYYHLAQVRTGRLITLLRGSGMPLDQIALVVDADVEAAIATINAYELSLDRRATASKFLLSRARQHYRGEDMSEVTTTLVPDSPVLTVLRRFQVDALDAVIARSVSELRTAADAAGLSVQGDPFGVFHAPIDSDSDGPLEIGIPTDSLASVEEDVRSYRLMGGRFACRSIAGPQTDWPAILGSYDEVCSWIDDSGHARVGPPRETWHTSPGGEEPLRLTISWPYA